MNLQEIIDLNYNATVKRGQIKVDTKARSFVYKLRDELIELDDSIEDNFNEFDTKELADCALVCFAMAKHFGIDLIKEMEEKAIYNSKRKD